MAKKLLYITFILVGLYILFSNARPYEKAIPAITGWFKKAWLSLTTGKAE